MAKVALLIGVSEYEVGLNPLPRAVKDAEAIQQVLQRPDIGEFAERDITLLKNPDRQVMEEAIENLFANRQLGDLVLLFFSGHGLKDEMGKLYLATSKTRKTTQGELIRSSAVAASFIHENMGRSRSKRQVVILDSCYSGAFAEGLSAKDDGKVNVRDQLIGEGRAILTSSTSTQYSFEQQGDALSIYTRYLIEGIITGAADRDSDGAVSVDELHEYASKQVREKQPMMKPEIYAVREGFKIRLTKVPSIDPKQRYHKEVEMYTKRGEVSFIGRKTLDALRMRLGLSAEETTAIEDQILAASRQKFKANLQKYEQDFREALCQTTPLNEAELNILRQNLQQLLGLRNEDTQPLEVKVKTQLTTYQQHLEEYEQAMMVAMRQEEPISTATKAQLQQLQQQWELTDADVKACEQRGLATLVAHREKLQQYERAFVEAMQENYPLTPLQRDQLLQQQQALDIPEEETNGIHARREAEFKAHQQKIQEYKQALTQTMEYNYPLTEENRDELRRLQLVLELTEEETAQIETKVVQQKKPEDTKRLSAASFDGTDIQRPTATKAVAVIPLSEPASLPQPEPIAPIRAKPDAPTAGLTKLNRSVGLLKSCLMTIGAVTIVATIIITYFAIKSYKEYASTQQNTTAYTLNQTGTITTTAAATPKLTDPSLSSYVRLQGLLATGKWKEADEETAQRMWEISHRTQDKFLRAVDFEQFPCTELRVMDQLWTQNSKNHFGFSAQRNIWESNDVNKDLAKFIARVGWGKYDGSFIYQSMDSVPFSLALPTGSLPWAPTYYGGNNEARTAYIARIITCDLK
ncbi:MAG: GUN4 domain-containing protein [Caldilineaceae bacterium]